ncbi:MAG: hypothetical protein H6744_06650 [Deltaproteobacteria bacterium]|nr:hypothetical protein [Deltaproteobacteria bacterium]MCB9786360.1 hypothetical protein [Deltaproteobacteria bacterium]
MTVGCARSSMVLSGETTTAQRRVMASARPGVILPAVGSRWYLNLSTRQVSTRAAFGEPLDVASQSPRLRTLLADCEAGDSSSSPLADLVVSALERGESTTSRRAC